MLVETHTNYGIAVPVPHPDVQLLASELMDNLLQRRVRSCGGNQGTEDDDRGDHQRFSPAASRQTKDFEVAYAGEQHGGHDTEYVTPAGATSQGASALEMEESGAERGRERV
ncbi:hypothetical protein GUJ93_ZPchr0004g40319 [Zizania palustris]|uniref:Uncharacterized protein n=1 Tax=Zizania palustris TaxID=103762 RepID=A0A8J5SBN1_ZIZPA|nr:hypothetical protein GUJ93_ZPchr0004g40319 [Zizania palustris]